MDRLQNFGRKKNALCFEDLKAELRLLGVLEQIDDHQWMRHGEAFFFVFLPKLFNVEICVQGSKPTMFIGIRVKRKNSTTECELG